MPQTRRSGVRIRYEHIGSGPPLVLVHGYTASGQSNWIASGWAERLSGGHTLLIPDLRGHGRSQKPYASGAYSVAAMAGDVLAVMDKEGIESAPVFGYSMGGMVTLELLLEHEQRVSAAIIGGMGSYFPRGRGRFSIERQHRASTAPRRPTMESIKFLASYISRFDPIAIEAAYRGVFKNGRPVDPARLAEITQPVLVAAGDLDVFFEPARALAAEIPGARFLALANEGHLSAVRNPTFMAEASAFLHHLPVAEPTFL
jgi:pimeloyl-ACP methyl ester carboxylesterase